jgi:hypothetical protein
MFTILYGVTSENTVSSGTPELLIITDNYFFQQRFFHTRFLYINLGTKCDGSIRIAGSSMASSFSVQVYPSPCFPQIFIFYSFLPEMPYGKGQATRVFNGCAGRVEGKL